MTDKQTVKFGDIAKQTLNRITPKPGDEKRFIGLQHLNSGDLKIHSWGGDITLSAQGFSVSKGDIIFARRNTYLKRVGISPIDGICSGDAMVIKPILGQVIPAFLPIFMQSDLFMNRVISISSGSLSSRVKWKDLEGQLFSIPSIAKQQEIVKIQSQIQKVIEANYSLYFSSRSLLSALVRTTFTPNDNWVSYKLSDLCDVKGGRQRNPENTMGLCPYKYLRPANIKRGEWKFSDIKEMDFTTDELSIYSLHRGDILLVEGGESIDVGDSAYWTGDINEIICFQNTLIRLRVNEKILNSREMFWLVTYLHRTGVFRTIAAGTKIKHIGTKNTSQLKVKLPMDVSSIKEQVGAIDKANTELQMINSKLKTLKSLYNSSLATLMRG